MSIDHITILGGGPAGLAAGYYLTKIGVKTKIFEANATPGGNCRTVQKGDIRYDFGAHRLHNVYKAVTKELQTLLGDDLKMINVPSHVYFNGKWAKFPLTPGGLLKVLGPAHVAKAMGQVLLKSGKNEENFRDDAINKYGKMVAEAFLLNYSEKLWGVPTSQLSPRVSGKRLKGLNVRSILKDVLLQRHSEHLDGAFYYPKYGFGQLMEAVAEKVNGLQTNAAITRVLHRDNKILGVELNGKEVVKDEHFINTLPLSLFIRLLDPAPEAYILEMASQIRFRHVRLMIFEVNKEGVSKSASLYFPSEDIPFTRVYEPKQRSAAMAPAGKTCLVVEYPYFTGEPTDKQSLEEIADQTKKILVQTNLIKQEEVLRVYEERLPYAYPVLELETEKKVKALEKYLKTFQNLYSLGRSASFEYTHFHDLMYEASKLSKKLTQI